MHYCNPDYIDINRFRAAVRTIPEPQPLSLANRLILLVGMIVASVAALLFIIGVGRLLAAF